MQIQDVMRASFGRSKMVTDLLLADFSDAEILVRPVAGANHTAWQLGHLVSSLNYFGESIEPASMPPLPPGFAERHTKETADTDDSAMFLSKSEYLGLLDTQRQALIRVLDTLPESRLADDAPAEMREYAPKISDVLSMAAEHELMHSGQFSVARRRLGKPVAF
ncbi:MAG: DinB family protein [Pirellulaceae bacterium]